MCGPDLLYKLNIQLNRIFSNHDPSVPFGGISILAFGDLYQLPSVKDQPIFGDVSSKRANLSSVVSLWRDFF